MISKDERDSELIFEEAFKSKDEEPDFIDVYMSRMEKKFNNKCVISHEAFIPGDSEDIIPNTGNKKLDLQDYLTKILRKEKFYRIKTDYLANIQGTMVGASTIKENQGVSGTFMSGGILINITINKVYVFHKNLKELEDFFSLLLQRIDDNLVLHNLITQILTSESIRYSNHNSNID